MAKETKSRPPKWMRDAVRELQDQAKFWLELLEAKEEDEALLQLLVFKEYVNSEEYLK